MEDPVRFKIDEFGRRIARVREMLIMRRPWGDDPDLKRHLYLGLLHRVRMIEHSCYSLVKLPEKAAPPLSLPLANEVNVAINALYLNLRGSLDNLGWSLVYRLQLRDPVDEDKRDHRWLSDLFGKGCLGELKEADPELWERLDEHTAWGRGLAQLRDPAAHRVPIIIHHSILFEEDKERVDALDEAFEESLAEEGLDLERHSRYQQDRRNAGQFLPLLTVPGQEGLGYASLFGLLNNDLTSFFEVVELVLCLVFVGCDRNMYWDLKPLPRRR